MENLEVLEGTTNLVETGVEAVPGEVVTANNGSKVLGVILGLSVIGLLGFGGYKLVKKVFKKKPAEEVVTESEVQ